MRRILFALVIALPIIPGLTYPQKKRTNIIIIMADDMGYSDIGCFGSEIETPNLDGLARNGLRITQFYNASRCCPTRASLLTGLYQHQAGVGEMVNDRHLPGYRGFLSDSSVTIAEVLREAGYRTYMTGKWHVGERRPHWPRDRGFDRYFGLINGATSHFRILNYRPHSNITLALDDDSVAAPRNYYSSDAFTDYAMRFLEEDKNSKKPFFLYLAFTAPHWPLHAQADDIVKYKDRYAAGWDKIRSERLYRMKQLGILDNNAKLSPVPPRMGNWDTIPAKQKLIWQEKMAVYAAMIDRIDQNVGRLMEKLKQLGEDKNTLIVCLSDNGGSPETISGPGFTSETISAAQKSASDPSSFTSYELPGAVVSNTPFRMYKAFVHEGGISTPFIAWFPSMIKGGEMKTGPALITDLMPTCVELAAGKYPRTFNQAVIQPVEGISLVPLVRGNSWKGHDAIFFEHLGKCAARMGDWKIVLNREGKWELYNIKEDRSELNNLSNEFPDKLKMLAATYQIWVTRTGVIPFEKRRQQQDND